MHYIVLNIANEQGENFIIPLYMFSFYHKNHLIGMVTFLLTFLYMYYYTNFKIKMTSIKNRQYVFYAFFQDE